MADYPISIWAGNTRGTNLSDAETHTVWHDEVMAEVIAVQTELGTNPSGPFATVAARLTAIDGGNLCVVSTSTGNTLTSGTSATISWESEVLDPSGWFTSAAPTLITPTIAGWYQVSVSANIAADPEGDSTLFQVRVQRSSTDVFAYSARPSAATTAGAQFFGTTPPLLMNGSSDTLRILAAQVNTDADARTYTGFFSAQLLFRT